MINVRAKKFMKKYCTFTWLEKSNTYAVCVKSNLYIHYLKEGGLKVLFSLMPKILNVFQLMLDLGTSEKIFLSQ